MRIAIDFDDTIVKQNKPYAQTDGKFDFMPGAKVGLYELANAGHRLLLWSARASLHLRKNWRLDLFRSKPPRSDEEGMKAYYALNEARFVEMVNFVDVQLPGVFFAVCQGNGSKPSVDLFIDDKALHFGGGNGWPEIAANLGNKS